MEPGTYGIRRNGPKVADPILCTRDGCYVSAGAERPAVFLPGRKALGFGNTWGARAGACRNTLGCVFRGVELGALPGFLQPVDLHILKHDRRVGHAVLADSDCRTEAGRLSCRHGIDADNYAMWIIPRASPHGRTGSAAARADRRPQRPALGAACTRALTRSPLPKGEHVAVAIAHEQLAHVVDPVDRAFDDIGLLHAQLRAASRSTLDT